MFLRENTMMPLLQEIPRHIRDENFRDLILVMNLTGKLCQDYYDDGICGSCCAELENDILTVNLTDIPAASFRVYAASPIHQAVVNGIVKTVSFDGTAYVF